jgi:hypothetical protein
MFALIRQAFMPESPDLPRSFNKGKRPVRGTTGRGKRLWNMVFSDLSG